MAKRSREHGHSVVELALFLPFPLFLFVGAFDWGFYAWALITTGNAARAAALYTSASRATASDSLRACPYVLAEFQDAPNVAGSLTACWSAPVTLVATAVTGPDGDPASQVSATYQTPVLIPIPGLLTGQLSITRVVEMQVRR